MLSFLGKWYVMPWVSSIVGYAMQPDSLGIQFQGDIL